MDLHNHNSVFFNWQNFIKMKRYEFLRNFTFGLAAFSILPSMAYCESGSELNAIYAGNAINESFNPDLDIELTAAQRNIQVLPGNKTEVYSYVSDILKAENATVENLPGSWLEPVFRVKQGQKVRVRFKNQLIVFGF